MVGLVVNSFFSQAYHTLTHNVGGGGGMCVMREGVRGSGIFDTLCVKSVKFFIESLGFCGKSATEKDSYREHNENKPRTMHTRTRKTCLHTYI